MKKSKVLITRKLPEAAREILTGKGYDVLIRDEERETLEEFLKSNLNSSDALIPLLSDPIGKEVIDQAPNLRIIANYAAGYNNIDIDYARSKGIVVTNTPDVLTNATADLTWALILSVAKRVTEGDRFVRDGKFSGWGPLLMLGAEITGKVIGIIGAGRIGQAVGRRAAGFEMSVLYTSNQKKQEFEQATGAMRVDLEMLLSRSDIISLHCPLTDETRHLIDKHAFSLMKKTVIFINTSRGPVVDESALAEALENSQIGGAGLDVYEFEPEITTSLLKLNNVILLPHMGSATPETRTEMARMAANNVIAVLENKAALNPVW